MKSLRSNIYTSFAVIVALLIAIGLFGYLGANKLNQSSTAIRQVSKIDAAVSDIDGKVTELQLRVSRYMATGHDWLRDDIIRLNDDLIVNINERAKSQTDPEMQDLFLRMSERLPEYRSQFDSVIEERGLRTNLVQKQLPAKADQIDALLHQMMDLAKTTQQVPPFDAAVLQCRSHFLKAKRLLLRYYIVADAIFVTDAIDQIDMAIESMLPLQATGQINSIRLNLIQELQDYKSLGIRSVQATRSYLYLVNVVMAGEAAEVTYFSNRLRRLSQTQHNQISQAMAVTTTSVRRTTIIGIGIAVAMGISIASRLGGLILKPVVALTGTFEQLAAGKTAVAIPGTQRKDEIGKMALAAEVFRQQNLEQEQLLENAKSLTTELETKANELETTNAELDSFAYVASHDLKSPLRGIRQLAVWIEEDAGHLLPEESVKHFKAMQSRVQRMERLLEDLLNFSRVGKNSAAPEIVDMNALLAGVIEMTDNPSHVKIQVSKPLLTLRTIRIPLEQIFLNLIGNAVKYNDKGEDGRIEIHWEQKEDHILFCFRDNGPGIAPKHHDRVFQMYQRVGGAQVDGSGMGLAIVKKQIESHHGTIQLDSNPDYGVTFTVSWPATLV